MKPTTSLRQILSEPGCFPEQVSCNTNESTGKTNSVVSGHRITKRPLIEYQTFRISVNVGAIFKERKSGAAISPLRLLLFSISIHPILAVHCRRLSGLKQV